MQKPNYFLFLIIFLCISVECIGQKVLGKNNLIINVEVHGHVSERYFIDVYKRSNTVKITYRFFDSIRFSAMRTDTSSRRIHAELMSYYMANDSLKNALINNGTKDRIYDAVNKDQERHSVYSCDSVEFNLKDDTALAGLLKRVATPPVKDFDLTPSNTRILDCATLFMTFITPSATKKTTVFCPQETSHPFTYALFTQILDAYRKRKHNDFLNKQRTVGY